MPEILADRPGIDRPSGPCADRALHLMELERARATVAVDIGAETRRRAIGAADADAIQQIDHGARRRRIIAAQDAIGLGSGKNGSAGLNVTTGGKVDCVHSIRANCGHTRWCMVRWRSSS